MKCQAISKTKKPCTKNAISDTPYCSVHQKRIIKEKKTSDRKLIPELENIVMEYLDLDTYLIFMGLNPNIYTLDKYQKLMNMNPDSYTSEEHQKIIAKTVERRQLEEQKIWDCKLDPVSECSKLWNFKEDKLKWLEGNIDETLKIIESFNIFKVHHTYFDEFSFCRYHFNIIWITAPTELELRHLELEQKGEELVGSLFIADQEPYIHKLVFYQDKRYKLKSTALLDLLKSNIQQLNEFNNKH